MVPVCVCVCVCVCVLWFLFVYMVAPSAISVEITAIFNIEKLIKTILSESTEQNSLILHTKLMVLIWV